MLSFVSPWVWLVGALDAQQRLWGCTITAGRQLQPWELRGCSIAAGRQLQPWLLRQYALLLFLLRQGLQRAALELLLKASVQLLEQNGVDAGCRLALVGLLRCCKRLRPRPGAAFAEQCGAAIQLLLQQLLLRSRLCGQVHQLRRLRLAKGSCLTALGC